MTSALIYAQGHGLAIGHLQRDLFDNVRSFQSQLVDNESACEGLDDRELQLKPLHTFEKLHISKENLSFLATCIRNDVPALDSPFVEYQCLRGLRLELPLLPPTTSRDSASSSVSYEVNFDAVALQPSLLDISSLDTYWSRYDLEAANSAIEASRRERIQTTRETLRTSTSYLRDLYTLQEQSDMLESILTRGEKSAPSPPTPLLLPMGDSVEPFSLEELLSELPSTPDDDLEHDWDPKRYEQEILGQDKIVPEMLSPHTIEDVKLIHVDSNQLPTLDTIAASPQIAYPASKACQPSTILKQSSNSSRPRVKGVAFSTNLEQHMVSVAHLNDTETLHQLLDDDNLAQMATLALEKIEDGGTAHRAQSNITARMAVPKFVIPLASPPWQLRGYKSHDASQSSEKEVALLLQQIVERSCVPVSGKLKRSLQWAPFSMIHCQPEVERVSGNESYVSEILKSLNSTIRSQDMLWKPDSMQTPFADSEDEEEAGRDSVTPADESSRQTGTTALYRDRMPELSRKRSQVQAASKDDRLSKMPRKAHPSSQSPTVNGLSSFMQLRGRSMSASHGNNLKGVQPVLDSSIEDDQACLIPATPYASQEMFPQMAESSVERTIVVSNTLLQTHRTLLGRLESAHHRLIYRDCDPALIISPIACIIFTNLQAAQQCPLPGQKTQADGPLQRQISQLSGKYETIHVLAVTPANVNGEVGPDSCKAIMSLLTFAAEHINGYKVNLIVIPPMSPGSMLDRSKMAVTHSDLHHHLLKWILVLAEKYGYSESQTTALDLQASTKFLEEETQWEVFLCKAGLNPFAAQIIIGLLKRIDHEGQSGLRALVSMPTVDRNAMLAKAIGVKAARLLDDIVDYQWQ